MDIQKILEEALMDGVVISKCKKCRKEIRTEPDAQTAWCEGCNKIVDVVNPLIIAGLI